MLTGAYLLPEAEFYVAVGNAGLWPDLTMMPDGEIVVAVYNRPNHGRGNGDVELWASDPSPYLGVCDSATQKEIVSDTMEAFERVLGVRPVSYRPGNEGCNGRCGQSVSAMARGVAFKCDLNIDSSDPVRDLRTVSLAGIKYTEDSAGFCLY